MLILHFPDKLDYGGENMKKEKPIITDPFGSYTGLTKEEDEKPVQDVDDL